MSIRALALLTFGGLLMLTSPAAADVITGPCKPPYLCVASVKVTILDGSGRVAGRGQTDANGAAKIKMLEIKGARSPDTSLTLVIDGKSLVAAMDRLLAASPVRSEPKSPARKVDVSAILISLTGSDTVPAAQFLSAMPYSRATALRDLKVRFQPPKGAGVGAIAISLEPASSTINE